MAGQNISEIVCIATAHVLLTVLKGGNSMKGKIKRLARDRGFGFISAENGEDVFFHRSALESVQFDSLEEGIELEFDLESGPKGPKAVNIKTI